jgi:hypothetical protein
VKGANLEKFQSIDRLKGALVWAASDLNGQRYRIKLYRFLTEQVPIINACVWTWVRLSSAQGEYEIEPAGDSSRKTRGESVLEQLQLRLFANRLGQRVGLASMIPDLFTGLYRDGFYGGFLTVKTDGSGVDQFVPIDPCYLTESEGKGLPKLYLETDSRRIELNRPDFYYLSLGDSRSEPLGGSILRAIPFVSYIEQQLVNDMRRTSHNSGFHRLHVKITPPDRMSGESDKAYTDRSNSYFDDTVQMIRDCDVDDNPVTWDNVAVEYIGPAANASVSTAWFMNHRAMIEDICAGTNLAPYLLGYSYGATTTWSGFKFDVVMRQVRSIQAEVSRFLEWIGNIELALAGVEGRCRFRFDNSFAYQALDQMKIESSRVDNLLKLYQAGLIDKEQAVDRAGNLI